MVRRHGKETAGRSALRGFASLTAASAFWGRPAIFTGGMVLRRGNPAGLTGPRLPGRAGFLAGSGVLRRGNPAGPAGRPGVDRRHGKETAGRSALRGFASLAAASAFWGRPAFFPAAGPSTREPDRPPPSGTDRRFWPVAGPSMREPDRPPPSGGEAGDFYRRRGRSPCFAKRSGGVLPPRFPFASPFPPAAAAGRPCFPRCSRARGTPPRCRPRRCRPPRRASSPRFPG